MIRRVRFNLIDNAIKFTATKPNAVITMGATQAEDEIIYSVVDNGIGFDRQFLGMGHRLVGVEYEGSAWRSSSASWRATTAGPGGWQTKLGRIFISRSRRNRSLIDASPPPHAVRSDLRNSVTVTPRRL
jgi:hypothetical protein